MASERPSSLPWSRRPVVQTPLAVSEGGWPMSPPDGVDRCARTVFAPVASTFEFLTSNTQRELARSRVPISMSNVFLY